MSNPNHAINIDVTFNVGEDKTEELLTAARRLVEAELEIAAAKTALHGALTTRKSFVEGVLAKLQDSTSI